MKLKFDPIKLPKELKEILRFDKRPAFLFVDRHTGLFPMFEKDKNGKEVCPYCGNERVEKRDCCTCSSSRKLWEYNKKVQ